MLRLLLAALIAVLSLPAGALADDAGALKRTAIERLAACHDPSIVIVAQFRERLAAKG